MDFNVWTFVHTLARPSLCLSNNAPRIVNGAFAGNSMRAVANVTAWRAYLPSDCVNTMIAMGWDRTT
jgi:hypothetical protein